MAIKETVFTLDLTREGRHPVVKFRLNDNKVQKITFRLTNNGREIDLEREMGDQFKPVFECIFRDKTFKRDEDRGNWEIKRDTTGKYPLYTFTYYLTDEVINKSGIACYYFALETSEGLRISTPTLKMVIDCDFKEDGKPSENYVSEFEKLLKEAERVKKTVDDLDKTLKEVLAGGASITEVIRARENANGDHFKDLKERLDKGDEKTNSDKRELTQKIDDAFNQTVSTNKSQPGIQYAGVIRNAGDGWGFITDTTHQNINFKSVETNENEIIVHFNDSKKVGGFVVTPDETLAAAGVTCGASVGTNQAAIRSYASLDGVLSGDGTVMVNEWFKDDVVVTKLDDGTGFYLDYKSAPGVSNSVLATTVRDAGDNSHGLEVRTAKASPGRAIFRSYDDLYAYIYYENGEFKIDTSCKANISVSFDEASGILSISHLGIDIDNTYKLWQSINVDMRKGVTTRLFHARVSSVSRDRVNVEIFNHKEERLMKPSEDMRLYFNRPGFKVPHVWGRYMRCYFNVGRAILTPKNFVSQYGNLWLLGVNNR
ncbi:TPA: BppU family phage baseplate upper protein [Bacillus paranthracis]